MVSCKVNTFVAISYPADTNPSIVSALPHKLNECSQKQKEMLLDVYVQDFISDEIEL